MRLIILAAAWTPMAAAQQYDFVLRGGRVIDPGNGIDWRMDVAVSNGRIAAVQPDIPAAKAAQGPGIAAAHPDERKSRRFGAEWYSARYGSTSPSAPTNEQQL